MSDRQQDGSLPSHSAFDMFKISTVPDPEDDPISLIEAQSIWNMEQGNNDAMAIHDDFEDYDALFGDDTQASQGPNLWTTHAPTALWGTPADLEAGDHAETSPSSALPSEHVPGPQKASETDAMLAQFLPGGDLNFIETATPTFVQENRATPQRTQATVVNAVDSVQPALGMAPRGASKFGITFNKAQVPQSEADAGVSPVATEDAKQSKGKLMLQKLQQKKNQKRLRADVGGTTIASADAADAVHKLAAKTEGPINAAQLEREAFGITKDKTGGDKADIASAPASESEGEADEGKDDVAKDKSASEEKEGTATPRVRFVPMADEDRAQVPEWVAEGAGTPIHLPEKVIAREVDLFDQFMQKTSNMLYRAHLDSTVQLDNYNQAMRRKEAVKNHPSLRTHMESIMHASKALFRHCHARFSNIMTAQRFSRTHLYEYVCALVDEETRLSIFAKREMAVSRSKDELMAQVRALNSDKIQCREEYMRSKGEEYTPALRDMQRKLTQQLLRINSQLRFYGGLNDHIKAELYFLRNYLKMNRMPTSGPNGSVGVVSASTTAASTLAPEDVSAHLRNYSNLISHDERVFLHDIQMKQTRFKNAYLDDYYHHKYTQNLAMKSNGRIEAVRTYLPVDEVSFRHKERQSRIDTSTSLGAIRFASAHAPRAVISVARATMENRSEDYRASLKFALGCIERGFDELVVVEDTHIRIGLTQNPRMKEQLFREVTHATDQVLKCIGLFDPVLLDVSADPQQQIERSYREWLFLRVLCLEKGRLLLERIVKGTRLQGEVQTTVVAMFIRVLSLLDYDEAVASFTIGQTEKLKKTVVPLMLALISRLPIHLLDILVRAIISVLTDEEDMAERFFGELGVLLVLKIFDCAGRALSMLPPHAQDKWSALIGRFSTVASPFLLKVLVANAASSADAPGDAATKATFREAVWSLITQMCSHDGTFTGFKIISKDFKSVMDGDVVTEKLQAFKQDLAAVQSQLAKIDGEGDAIADVAEDARPTGSTKS